MAIGILEHRSPDFEGPFFPGLPYILAVYEAMSGVDVGFAAGFIALNIVWIFIGLLASWYVISDDDSDSMAWNSILASLGSWLLIKFSTVALTDIPCMAFSMLAVHYCTRATRRSGLSATPDLLAACVCTVVACFIRPNAVALLPALGVAILSISPLRGAISRLRANKSLLAVVMATSVSAVVVGVGAAVIVMQRLSYGRDLLGKISKAGDLGDFVAGTLFYRSVDSAETLINFPLRFVPDPLRQSLMLVGGVAFLSLIALAIARLPRLQPSHAYLLAFLAILAIWPYSDPRFLIPVLPLVFRGWFVFVRRLPQVAVGIYAAVFATGTALALAYSTMITFSGSEFPSVYSVGLANSYRIAAGHAQNRAGKPPIPAAVALIQRYGDARINAKAGEPSPE